MKPQLALAAILCAAIIQFVACQVPASQRSRYYNAEGCNTTESLVFEYQVGIVGDGCSDTPCSLVADNLWLYITCSEPSQVVDGLSYISSYTTTDCGNETALDERILFNPSITGCFNVFDMSFYVNNTCTLNGEITLERFSTNNCSASSLLTTITGSDGTCTNSTYAYCVVGVPPQAPSASEPISSPTSASPVASSPQPTNTPKSTTSTPKASSADGKLMISFGSLFSALLLLL